VLDCGLLHTFDADERRPYAQSLASATERGATLYVICFSDEGADLGPHPVSREELTSFGATSDWEIASIEPERLRTRFHGEQGAPAWLATIKRL
jgi:hypothetical protein